MRILLTSTAAFVPPRGGSTRSNLAWLEELSTSGHTCRVVCGLAPAATAQQRSSIQREAERQGFHANLESADMCLTLDNGIDVRVYEGLPLRKGVVAAQIEDFAPDWVLVSSEDLGHSLLREASEHASGRVVYLAHTPQFFPFGPESWSLDSQAAERVREAAAVVVIGEHMAGYVREHLGREAVVIHPPLYGSGPFENFSRFEKGFVLMINPCAVKGISIFAALAEQFHNVRFGALPGWGTTDRDLARLRDLSNVTLLQSVRRIEEVLRQARILLVPSLWYEGFGLIVMEAMLRGIPVISSDSGGLVEAKNGTEFVVPVQPIREYQPQFDEVRLPLPVLPKQRDGLWSFALESLLTEGSVYQDESARSREQAHRFVSEIRPRAMEEMLNSLRAHSGQKGEPQSGSGADRLSPARRSLLLSRLRALRARL